MRSQKVYCNYLRSALILLAVLTFGFFNASGHIISAALVSPAQIEETNYQSSTSDKCALDISQEYLLKQDYYSKPVLALFRFNNTYLVCHKTLISVKYQSLRRKSNQFNPIFHVLELIRISRNSDDPFKS